MTSETEDYNGIAENEDGDMPSVHPLAFDWAIYAHHLKESDLTGEQQRQLIETLWTIASLFVDYGFGLHPVQQVCKREACGEEADLAALIAEDMLCCTDQSIDRDDVMSDGAMPLSEGSPV